MKLLLLILATVYISKVKSESGDDEQHLVSVSRRLSSDIYYYNGSNGATHCDNDDHIYNTYLVDERLCVAEEELYKRASQSSLAIIPAPTSSLITVTIFNSQTSNMTYLKTAVGRALFKFNATDQSVNSTFCHIASLEVFRGWKQAVEIDRGGFTLSDNGSIEIDKNELAYSVEDFTGELYRMNLICSNNALPERGSLFFKVIGNSTVTRAKFDCTVPGTLTNFTEECNITTTVETQQTTTLPLTTTTVVPPPTDNPSGSAGQMHMIYLYAVVGGGVAFLLVFALLVCSIVCLLRRRLRSKKMQTAQVEDQKGRELQSPVKLDESHNIYNTLNTYTEHHHEMPLCNGETHNVYARLETPPPQNHPNGFHQRSTLPMAINGTFDKQVQDQNESGHEYETPLATSTRKVQDDSDPSQHIYAAPDRRSVGAIRSASISVQRSMEQQQSGIESDPNNHHYHILEQPPRTQSLSDNFRR